MARLDELERKFEENPRRYFAPLANEYRKAGDAKRAADLCRAQLPELPGHISGHIVLGQALFDSGDFSGSRAALETALALDPENIVALRYLGDIARATGDTAEAERWYSRTLEADPYNEAATLSLQSLHSLHESAQAPITPAAEPPTPNAHLTTTLDEEPSTPTHQEIGGSSESLPESSALEDTQSAPAFAGDLAISAASESADQTVGESPEIPLSDVTAAGAESVEVTPVEVTPVEVTPVEVTPVEVTPVEVTPVEVTLVEVTPVEVTPVEVMPVEVAPAEAAPAEAPTTERFDVEAHAPSDPPIEEAIQAEERVMESAAPFVTETMAELYLEQGYPHEALELLLQLAEQRPQDEQLRAKIESVESVIVARRDAAVAAARAERAETSQAAGQENPLRAEESAEPADAAISFEIPPFEPETVAPMSVREMFARMDRVRPRPANAPTPRPLSRLRSDFVPMPGVSATDNAASDDPFAFPDTPQRAENPAGTIPRTSGPQPAFNPSTAPVEDFDAWLRGLKGS